MDTTKINDKKKNSKIYETPEEKHFYKEVLKAEKIIADTAHKMFDTPVDEQLADYKKQYKEKKISKNSYETYKKLLKINKDMNTHVIGDPEIKASYALINVQLERERIITRRVFVEIFSATLGLITNEECDIKADVIKSEITQKYNNFFKRYKYTDYIKYKNIINKEILPENQVDVLFRTREELEDLDLWPYNTHNNRINTNEVSDIALDRLAEKDKDFGIKWNEVKQGINLDIHIKDEDSNIREKIARQGYGLDILINDEDAFVRTTVAEKGYGLDILIKDKNEHVRHAVYDQNYGLDNLNNPDINEEEKNHIKTVSLHASGCSTIEEWIEKYPDRCTYISKASDSIKVDIDD